MAFRPRLPNRQSLKLTLGCPAPQGRGPTFGVAHHPLNNHVQNNGQKEEIRKILMTAVFFSFGSASSSSVTRLRTAGIGDLPAMHTNAHALYGLKNDEPCSAVGRKRHDLYE